MASHLILPSFDYVPTTCNYSLHDLYLLNTLYVHLKRYGPFTYYYLIPIVSLLHSVDNVLIIIKYILHDFLSSINTFILDNVGRYLSSLNAI